MRRKRNFLSRFVMLVVCTIIIQSASVLLLHANLYAAVDTRPNIILINVDDMGYGDLKGDALKCGVAGAAGTPCLQKLASQGITLTNFYTPSPLCTPSRAALMTGRDPRRISRLAINNSNNTGVLLDNTSTRYLPQSEITIAEVLKASGYNTAIIGKWNLGWGTDGPKQNNSWNHGFDYNYVLPLGIGQSHKGFCLATANINTGPTVTWYYIGDILGLSTTVDNYTADQFYDISNIINDVDSVIKIDACNKNYYDPVAASPHCPVGTAGTYCNEYFSRNEGTLFTWKKSATGESGFWKFSQAEDPTPNDANSLTQVLTDQAKKHINNIITGPTTSSSPFFLYLAYPAPHTPLYIHLKKNQLITAPTNTFCGSLSTTKQCTPQKVHDACEQIDTTAETGLDSRQQCEISALYPYVLTEIDSSVKQILDLLDSASDPRSTAKKLQANTIVIFTSDNGPYMGRDAQFPDRGSTGGLRGGKKFTYEGGARVPFIARWPNNWPTPDPLKPNIKPGDKLYQFADMRDIFPTLTRVALKDSGLCSDGIDICVQNGANANDTGRIRFTGKNNTYYDIAFDGKDISNVLSTEATNTNQKNVQISWFGNYSICVPGNGVCTNTEDSHPFAIRSNVISNVPADIGNYKLYFLGDKPAATSSTSDVRLPVELYNFAYNPSEVEMGSSNLCMVVKKPLITNECLKCNSTDFTCPTLPTSSKTYGNIRARVEFLWKRAYLYQNNVKNNYCEGTALFPDRSCPTTIK